MRIFLTGGAGLLGSKLAEALGGRHQVTAAGHSKPIRNGDRDVALDITDAADIARNLDGQGYDLLVHTAAVRSPEECVQDPLRAYRINAVAVEFLAEACRRNGMKMVYIATDYLFPGDKPPYREDSFPSPVNLYGRTKLAGEFATVSVPRHLSVRVPIMWADDPVHSRVSQKDLLDQFARGERVRVESALVRHYSHAADIAAGIAFCIDRDVCGRINIAAQETQTKADYARAVAVMHGFDPGLVIDAGEVDTGIVRPHDPTLDTGLYNSLGGPRIRGLSEWVAALRKR